MSLYWIRWVVWGHVWCCSYNHQSDPVSEIYQSCKECQILLLLKPGQESEKAQWSKSLVPDIFHRIASNCHMRRGDALESLKIKSLSFAKTVDLEFSIHVTVWIASLDIRTWHMHMRNSNYPASSILLLNIPPNLEGYHGYYCFSSTIISILYMFFSTTFHFSGDS